MKIGFIATVLNEEKTIEKLLESLSRQSLLPMEVIIADGGSKDKTIERITEFQKKSKFRIKIIKITGNRSVGRNTAVNHSTFDVIVCSDAGCDLDKNWVKNITKPFENPEVEVVAGYYKGLAENLFQKCIIPYVLVMPDKVNPASFLPATRSMAFRKSVWEKVGKFDEKLSHNEDFAFASLLKRGGVKIEFVKDAIVSWYPPKNLKKAFIMFYRFAYGDAEAGIFRPKVILIYARYMVGVLLLTLAIIKQSGFLFNILTLTVVAYIIWGVVKNYKYVKDWRACFVLPVLQFTSDIAVLTGTTLGLAKPSLK